MKIRFSRRGVALAAVLLLALFLVRPQVGGLRERVARSISLAIGRRIEIGSLHLRFLPRPGFELENLVVYDDPAFGAEPLVRAAGVNAWLRVIALFRGHIEISNLSLTEASLNLTRDAQGRWDLEDLLERTSAISVAPTASGGKDRRPAFPYIEASRARINFKSGTEKTHFALTDAEFSLWQDSENTWSMRLKAQPIRTDFNLTDTGVVNVSGTWQRARLVQDTPLQISFQWKQAQIGQASKLFYGADQGWRGSVVVSGAMVGTPANLQIAADSSIDDFRRQDLLAHDDLRLAAHCVANYSSPDKAFSDIDCSAPAGDGSLELKGNASGLPFSQFELSLISRRVPAQSVLALIRRVNGRVTDDLTAAGALNAALLMSRHTSSDSIHWSGDGELRELALSSASSTLQLVLGRVPLTVTAASQAPNDKGNRVPEAARLEIGPINVALGRPAPLQARGSLSLADYQMSIHGDAGIKRLLQVAHMLNFPVPAVAADGNSTVDLALAGAWRNAERHPIVGTSQLRAVRAEVRGLNAPLQITSANLVLEEHSVKVQNLNASVAGSAWRGTLELPRGCAAPESCGIRFNLHSPEVNAAALNQLLNPRAGKQSWYRFLSASSNDTSYLLRTRASGRFAIDRLVLGKAICNQFTADSRLESGKLTVANVRGQLLAGKLTGDWLADFSAKPPQYSGSGSFAGISLAQIADLMNDDWISGNGEATYRFKSSGRTLQDLLQSADLSADFAIEDGGFPHIVLTTDSEPLHASTFAGRLSLSNGKFSFEDAKLENLIGVYRVTGTASLNGALNLKLAGESAIGYNVSGTLIQTRVSQIPNTPTQASLKP